MSIFLFLFFIFGIIQSEPLILEFKTRINIDKDNVMKSLIINYIYTNFIVGSNQQQMEMNIRTQRSSTFLVSESCTNNKMAVKFKESESESYNKKLSIKYYGNYEYNAALSEDTFIILQNNNIQMLVDSLWDSYQEYLGGMIGLKLQKIENGYIYTPEDTDFIYQLKLKNKIISSVFVLEYEDDLNGKLYIGDYFHEFNDYYSEKDFISTRVRNADLLDSTWELNIEKILSGNKIFLDEKTYLVIYYEYGIIAAPEYYKAEINSTFFNDYYTNDICKVKFNQESIGFFKKYNYIVCEKNNFDKTAFPKLSFYNEEMNKNFSLSHEDLFYEYEDEIYFLVVFPIYSTPAEYWLIGKPFIKKYKLFLDENKKTIGLYNEKEEEKVDEKENEKVEEHEQLVEEKIEEEEEEKASELEQEQENLNEKINEQEQQEEQEKVIKQEQEIINEQENTKEVEMINEQENTKEVEIINEQENTKEVEIINKQEDKKEVEMINEQENSKELEIIDAQESMKEQENVSEAEKVKEQEYVNDQGIEKENVQVNEPNKNNKKDSVDNKNPAAIIIIVILIITILGFLYYFFIYKKLRSINLIKAEDNIVDFAESENKTERNKI